MQNKHSPNSGKSKMTGQVMTVNGPIDPSEVGTCIMHEHLFIDFWRDKAPGYNAPATEVAHWSEQLTLENLHLARSRKHIKDNYLLTDESVTIKDVMAFRNVGGNTIVDVTNIGLGRDPLALQRVANATGLNIVMGSGWYQRFYHPKDMDQRTVQDLADEIIGDVTVGVGNTGVRSGIIGEVGINGNPLTPNEEKSVRASARASRTTGAAISFHHGGMGQEKFKVASMLVEEGADLTRTIYGHSNSYAGDVPFLLELLALGVYVQFDTLGRVMAPVARRPVTLGGPGINDPQVATDVLVAEAIPQLIEAGYVDQILLSQDVCMKIHLKAYGGTGYAFVLEKFLPFLRTQGVTDEHIHKMMVENPARALSFVEPA
jgi:phosphotriesterase-related protein